MTEELPVAKRREPLPEELYRKFVDITYQQMWDYLEAHVYDCWDISIQEFLMEVSIADSFDVQLAERITGRNEVEKLIEKSDGSVISWWSIMRKRRSATNFCRKCL